MMKAKLVPIKERTNTTARLFGPYYPMRVEPMVFSLADQLSNDYSGGYWGFYTLNDGQGFFLCPDTDQQFTLQCPNGYTGKVSGEAYGIIVCLYSFSYLSFDTEHPYGQLSARMYHQLREFALDHNEAAAIFRAID